MNSLSELNDYGNTSLTVTDTRPSNVIFDKMPPATFTPQVVTISESTSVTSLTIVPENEILNVINYSTANVRYKVTIVAPSGFSSSTLTFGTLPPGVTLNQSGQAYTISGINSSLIWDQIKTFTWNIPADHASYNLWYLNLQIIYFDSKLNTTITRSWNYYDDRYFYVAELSSTSTLQASAVKYKTFTASLSSAASLSAVGRVKPYDLQSQFTLTSTAKRIRLGASSISTSATLAANADKTKNITNIGRQRYYDSNIQNLVFATNIPQIVDDGGSYTYTSTFTAGYGLFGTGTSGATTSISLTGTKAQLNAWFPTIKFYPIKGYTSNTQVNYVQSRNTIEQFTINIPFYWTGTTGTITTQTTTHSTTADSITLTLTDEQYLYGLIDYTMVGCGGAGYPAVNAGGGIYYPGGGGGAGAYYSGNNILPQSRTIGMEFGIPGQITTIGNPDYTRNGGQSFIGGAIGTTIYLNGGQGGQPLPAYPSGVNGGYLGAVGIGTGPTGSGIFLGGNAQYGTTRWYAGGGAGAGGAGGNATTTANGAGGAGINSPLFGAVVAAGGGGGTNSIPTNYGSGGGGGSYGTSSSNGRAGTAAAAVIKIHA
ncbi:hypothetical protein UFOVP645_32 [uncultured Caudovirales phage]|uniref:Uncharacterized protein n=1 Tax=uncultured Caudovirales phage TaxID=2100421 RepID=A0A6J5N8J2_9CAUD|nr:hypothetical protein UFOVP645_32 [uncultured Caudovirales phage]